MPMIEKSIEVNVPVNVAYDQWTQFEDFPQFMQGVIEVTQINDTHLHWVAEIAGRHEEWEAEITEQIPDKRIAWHSISGARNAGVVTFHPISPSISRIMLQMEYDPEGFLENAGDTLGLLTHRVTGDMERFKEFIETRRAATGSWRGEVDHDTRHVTPPR